MHWINSVLLSLFLAVVSLFFPDHSQQKSTNAISPVPTLSISVSPSIPMVTPTEQTVPASFIYPNASVQSNSGDTIVMKSSDNPNAIMQWYQGKISSLNMHNVSNVQTNTNNNITDVIVASNDTQGITVKVEKGATDTQATITVSTKTATTSSSGGSI